ncbi:MAG TPA: hypothetical protein PLK99_05350 [Burkholderiales bacterium]|nr:hypothetical protein [Burkholderiales bacterium]
MALCTGERKTNQMQCYGTLYKFNQCDAEGCMQNREHACSNRGFSAGERCCECGAVGWMEMLPNEDCGPRKTPMWAF